MAGTISTGFDTLSANIASLFGQRFLCRKNAAKRFKDGYFANFCSESNGFAGPTRASVGE
jgi:hypothetical protein